MDTGRAFDKSNGFLCWINLFFSHRLTQINTDMNTIKYKDLIERIIKDFYETFNELGHGFLESVYEKALAIVLRSSGLKVESQLPISVFFRNQLVGDFRADLIVEDKVIIELKAVRTLLHEHKVQILNYLKATKYEVGLLLNFGTKSEIRRFVFDNERKICHKSTQKINQNNNLCVSVKICGNKK